MSSLSDIKNSKFLKKEDVGEGALLTIRAVTKENVAMEGVDPEWKFCLHFEEMEKPMVLNSGNAQMVAKIAGSEEEIEKTWLGIKLVAYNEPSVQFAGKVTGGIRIRAPKLQGKADLPF